MRLARAWRHLLPSVLVLPAFLLQLAPAPAEATVAGRAYGAWLNLPSRGIHNQLICDTGWLPSNGGNLYNYTPPTDVPGVLAFDSMDATSQSDDCIGESFTQVRSGVVFAGQSGELRFNYLMSRDDDECCNGDDDDFHKITVTGLQLNGQPLALTGLPNQVIDVPGVGTLVANEVIRHFDDDCDDDDLTLNAFHYYLTNGDEVILASSYLDDDDDCCPVQNQGSTWGRIKGLYR